MKQFVLGFTLGTIGITLLSTFDDIINALQEAIKAKIGVKITEYTAQMNMNVVGSENNTHAIGFTIDTEEDY